jgi:hypothetical protein
MYAGARQMSAGGGGVNSGRGVVKVLESGVRDFTRQMCVGARQMSAGGRVVSPGGNGVKLLEGVVSQFARRICPGAQCMRRRSTRGWSDEGRRYRADEENLKGTAEGTSWRIQVQKWNETERLIVILCRRHFLLGAPGTEKTLN